MPNREELVVLRYKRNHLLSRLAAADAARVAPYLETVDLPARFPLEAAHRPISHVYFPEEGLVSVVALGSREQIDVGIIGRDGMSGHAVLLGTDRSPNVMYMQLGGHGTRITADHLRAALRQSETLRAPLLAFLESFHVQTSHTALANGRAKLETRLARWLLMAHDRQDSDRLSLTHEFLAIMLGVRRPGVTVAVRKLEAAGMLEAQRNAITIRNRKGLEMLADGVYGVPETEQLRLTGWKPPHHS